jgi:nicotinamidase-related amidase
MDPSNSMPNFLSVDLQNDFASEGGMYYVPGEAMGFIRDVLVPFMRERSLEALEIISDYRQPRKGDPRDCCRPGEWGFISNLPDDIRKGKRWVKAMNSPVWTRKGAGDPNVIPEEPYQDPDDFGRWLTDNLGAPEGQRNIIVFGLTLDRCVLSTVMELSWRGYRPVVLTEATDLSNGDPAGKNMFLRSIPFIHWGETMTFNDLKRTIGP